MFETGSREYYGLIAFFDKIWKGAGRLDKEDREYWRRGHVYQQGDINDQFLAFREGVAYGYEVGRADGLDEAEAANNETKGNDDAE